MPNRMVRRRVLVLGAIPLLLAGCGSESLQERAHDRLQKQVDGVQEMFLDRRAHDLESTGTALLESLDPWSYAIDSTVVEDGVALVWGVAAEVSETKGWMWPETTTASVGACVLVVVRTRGGQDDRGVVRTEPVPCPDGTEILDDIRVDELTTDVEGGMDDVPLPPPDRSKPCYSGGDCSEGGG
jgi:hypothetical protein